VKGSTTADPAAVVDCCGCPGVGGVVGADAAADDAAGVVAEAVAVAPEAGAAVADAAEAAADIAEDAAVPGVAEEPGLDAPVLEHAAFPTMATTIATVPAILLN
jgi:hypothetical protein